MFFFKNMSGVLFSFVVLIESGMCWLVAAHAFLGIKALIKKEN